MTELDREGKRQTQGGVQAIFTTDQGRYGKALPAIGLLTLGGGVTIWLWALRELNISNGANLSQGVASWALTLASLAMLIVLAGTGLTAYSLAVRRTTVGRNTKGFSLHPKNPDIGLTNQSTYKDRSTGRYWDSGRNLKSTRQVSKTFLAALVQSLVYVACYIVLVAEYNNNTRIQAWVHNNLPLIGNLLNYYGVLLLSGILGVFIVQFFSGEQSST